MQIVPLYAAFFALFFIVLSMRVVRLRYKFQTRIGDGGQPELLRSVRVHGNFAEFVPFALLLMWMVETHGASAQCLHILGGILVIARLAHAIGVSREPDNLALRAVGVVGTFGVLTASAVILVCQNWA